VREFTVDSPGATLAVRESRPDGDPILLLHGGPGVPDSMQGDIAPFLP
jgi:pimeloyl-ACP methyl ester carboxylesterase